MDNSFNEEKEAVLDFVKKLSSVVRDLGYKLGLDEETGEIYIQNDLNDKVSIKVQTDETVYDENGKIKYKHSFVFGVYGELNDNQSMKHICEIIVEKMGEKVKRVN